MIRFLLAIILLTIPAGSAAAQASGGEKIKQNLHDCLAGFVVTALFCRPTTYSEESETRSRHSLHLPRFSERKPSYLDVSRLRKATVGLTRFVSVSSIKFFGRICDALIPDFYD